MSVANVTVRRKPKEPIEKLIRRFRKSVDDIHLFQEIREREYFSKPSEKKRKKRARAAARRQKEARLEKKRLLQAKAKRDRRQKISQIDNRAAVETADRRTDAGRYQRS